MWILGILTRVFTLSQEAISPALTSLAFKIPTMHSAGTKHIKLVRSVQRSEQRIGVAGGGVLHKAGLWIGSETTWAICEAEALTAGSKIIFKGSYK